MITAARCLLVITAALPATVAAQTCAPSTSSNEAKIFGSRSLAFALGRGAAITTEGPGTVRGALEVVMLQHISDETARPTACRIGKGPENVNSVPAVGRGRVAISLPGRLTLEGAWVPPVPINGLTANLASAALAYVRPFRTSLTIAARVHTTIGTITGPITCSEDDLAEITSECYQGMLSDDEYTPNIFGGDIAIGRAAPSGAIGWYAGAGYSRLTPRFRVSFLNQFGTLDTTRVFVDLNRVPVFGGVSWSFGSRWRASAELYGTPDDGATVRILFDGVLRRSGS